MGIKSLIGLRIKELRNKSGFTQAELAELVNIDPKHQSCIENGRNFPSADLIEKYANAFKIEASEVIETKHIKDRKTLIKEITREINSASDDNIKLIHRIVFDILKWNIINFIAYLYRL